MLEAVPPPKLDVMHTRALRWPIATARSFWMSGYAYNVTVTARSELCWRLGWRATHRRHAIDCTALLPPAAAALVVPPHERTGTRRAEASSAATRRRHRPQRVTAHGGRRSTRGGTCTPPGACSWWLPVSERAAGVE
jgi:hypothetical protein